MVSLIGNLLLPPRCLLCGARSTEADLCRACADELPRNAAACARCALPLPQPEPACGECLRSPPSFVATLAPLRYAEPVDHLVTRFKFHAGLAEGRVLATLMCDVAPMLAQPPDAVVPVPLHRARLARRGYNQALELARPVAARLGVRVGSHALLRSRDTAPQTELDADARRRNLRGAFAANPDAIAGRHLLLVDDVITTGATVREAAATLVRAGAASVSVLAAARAPL